MMQCKVKFVIPFLLLLNSNIKSAENDIIYNNINQFDQLDIKQFKSIYQSLNKVSNTINEFISLVFSEDKLNKIVNSNDIET